MDRLSPDELNLLEQATDRARRLLDHLVRSREQLAEFAEFADSGGIPSPGLLAEGQALLREAADSARHLADDLGRATIQPADPSALKTNPL